MPGHMTGHVFSVTVIVRAQLSFLSLSHLSLLFLSLLHRTFSSSSHFLFFIALSLLHRTFSSSSHFLFFIALSLSPPLCIYTSPISLPTLRRNGRKTRRGRNARRR